MTISESDWKTFKGVREVALDRFSLRILGECQSICSGDSSTPHERYGELYGLIQERDREMAHAFDDFRRSTAVSCLRLMWELGVVTEQELSEFSFEVQRAVRREL